MSLIDQYLIFDANSIKKICSLSDGDLGYYGTSLTAFMKQKHRMIWERRHGKIGTGRKDKQEEI